MLVVAVGSFVGGWFGALVCNEAIPAANMFSIACFSAGLELSVRRLNAVLCDDSGYIWSILSLRFTIEHKSATPTLSNSRSKTFLYLNGIPWMNRSLTLRVRSSALFIPAPASSTMARFASHCRSVRKSSGCSFSGSNFLVCKSSS